MLWIKNKFSKSYNQKDIITHAFATFLIINYLALLAIAYFNFNQSRYIREVREKQLFSETIQQQSKLLQAYNRQIIDSILQLYNSPLNKKLRQQNKLSQTDKLLAMRELNSFVTGSEYLFSAYVYNPAYGVMSSDDNFSSSDDLYDFKDEEASFLIAQAVKKETPTQQLFPNLRVYPKQKSSNIFNHNKINAVYHPQEEYLLTYILFEDKSALVVNVDASYLIKIMQMNPDQAVLLKMQSGEELLVSHDGRFGDFYNKGFIKLNLPSSKQSDFSQISLAYQKYLCCKVTIDSLAADLIYFLPEQKIFADIYTLKNQTYMLLISICIVFIILHVLLWRRVVSPFAEAVNEVTKLNKISLNPAKVLKYLRQQQFWQSIFNGAYTHNQDFNFVNAAKQLDLHFVNNYVYLILLENLAKQSELEEILQQSKVIFEKVQFMDKVFYVLNARQTTNGLGETSYIWPLTIINKLQAEQMFAYYSELYQAANLQKAVYHLIEMQKLNQLRLGKIFAEEELKKLHKAQGDLSAVSNLFSNLLNQEQTASDNFNEFIDNIRNYRLSSVLYILQNLLLQLRKKLGEISDITATNYEDQFNELVDSDFDVDDLQNFFLPLIAQYKQLKIAQHQEQVHSLASAVVKFISANIANFNLSLKLVAAEFNLNPTYLSKLFKESQNISISSYITKNRMEFAAYLLLHSELSNKQICEKIGIENNSYFYALFKKAYGLTPNEYKVQAQKKSQSKD